VIANLRDWLHHRTGYRTLMSALLIEHIPGGARWRYVWGSCLAFVFTIQLITGVLLMTAYSPGDSTAWSSVYFIQYQMDFGWFIRGLHHFGSQTMVVLLGLHMLQVVIAGAHLPPREINWWLGLLLLGCVLGLSLTGYLLPWDQKGYWATQVATNIAGNIPLIGAFLQKIVVGGPAYGHSTLTRFYALHVAVLPPLVIVLTVLHLVAFRRHGVTTPKGVEGEGWFWPDQAFRDLVVCLLIFGVMLGLVVFGHGHPLEAPAGADQPGLYERWAHAGRDGRGANLDAPADPSRPYPARPEWYFLFLFQLLKYFEGPQEVVGTVIIPNAVLVLLAVLPLLGIGRLRKFGHVVGVLVVTGLLTGAAALTCLAIADDMVDPIARGLVKGIGTIVVPAAAAVLLLQLGLAALLRRGGLRRLVNGVGTIVVAFLLTASGLLLYGALTSTPENRRIRPEVAKFVEQRLPEAEKKPREEAKKFHDEVEAAERLAARAVVLARPGIPAGGAVYLLQRDPLTQGPAKFGQSCAGCHNHGADFKNDKATASDLAGFGTEEWLLRLLHNPGHRDFFGRTGRTTMSGFIEENFPNVNATAAQAAKLDAEAREQLQKDRADLKVIAAWLAKHPRRSSPERDSAPFKRGFATFKQRQCLGCHSWEGQGGSRKNRGPDLTGYGDEEWLRLMVMLPAHPKRYGLGNTMPAFRDLEGPDGPARRAELDWLGELLLAGSAGDDKKAAKVRQEVEKALRVVNLSDVDRELIIRWLLGDGRAVFGGAPISGPPR
jgi:quinol-cytochrome oxidoreductase complex cytochrome b subunit/mono/diheme cytochrome c family protein